MLYKRGVENGYQYIILWVQKSNTIYIILPGGILYNAFNCIFKYFQITEIRFLRMGKKKDKCIVWENPLSK